ncbi:hypothetical protein BT93_C0411 [Corymbia citriodora subsp. variegata]|nr:hypothetical protein BT93_C0411 [Corymbia citriodora subsp. variegata]
MAFLNSLALLKHIPNLKVGFSISTSALKKSTLSYNVSIYKLMSPMSISLYIELPSIHRTFLLHNSSRSMRANPSSLTSLAHLLLDMT